MSSIRTLLSGLALATVLLGASSASAVTVDLNWQLNTTHNTMINVGDTVRWTWTDALPHSVTDSGGVETFDSGITAGAGTVFQHVFNSVGVTSYVCSVHANMNGTVTVTAPVPVLPSSALWLLALGLGLCAVFVGQRRMRRATSR